MEQNDDFQENFWESLEQLQLQQDALQIQQT